MILDCHTHKAPPCPEAIVSEAPDTPLFPGQLYSLGIHPWHIPSNPASLLQSLEEKAALPQVAAIGEAGLDTLVSTPMWLQLKVFEQQVALAEEVGKPLLIHSVRTAGEITQLRRSLRATMPWIIHGFRGKPSVLKMFLDAGCYVSFGTRFNPQSLALTPYDRILAETDESSMTICEVITALGESRGENLFPAIETNTQSLFGVSYKEIIRIL